MAAGIASTVEPHEVVEVAAFQLLQKLQAATHKNGTEWHAVHGLDENAVTIWHACDRGWIILGDPCRNPLTRTVALTQAGSALLATRRDRPIGHQHEQHLVSSAFPCGLPPENLPRTDPAPAPVISSTQASTPRTGEASAVPSA